MIWLDGSLEAAWALERKLFDLGGAVCVVESEAEASAARSAGMIAIVVGPSLPHARAGQPAWSGIAGPVIELDEAQALAADAQKLLERCGM